jgi:hypothetical protein
MGQAEWVTRRAKWNASFLLGHTLSGKSTPDSALQALAAKRLKWPP